MSNGLAVFTAFHTILSLLALVSGAIVIYGLVVSRSSNKWIWFFLATAVATSVTGFFFPFNGVTPAIAVGVIALLVLIAAFLTLSSRNRTGVGAIVFVVSLVISEYFLAFVAVAQAFGKVPALRQLAPTLKEPPFGIAQVVVLLAFVLLAVAAVRRRKQA